MSPAASGRPVGLFSFVAAALLGAAQLGASCVDGVTPDCSDPAACAPSEGDAAVAKTDGGVFVPDGGTSSDDLEAGLDHDAADASDAADGG